MSRDEQRYPEPDLFKPERYLTPDGKLDPDCTCDPETFVFGFGRRQVFTTRFQCPSYLNLENRKCVGGHIALSTAWITIASVLATFNISKAKDEFGNIIEPIVDFRSAAIVAYVPHTQSTSPSSTLISFCSLPSPFKCSITVRSREAEKLIYAAAEHDS